MTRPAPLTPAEEIATLVETFGLTVEEAAQKVAERAQRAADLANTTDPDVLLPAIAEELKLHARFERIVKTVSTPPHYRIETDCGSVHLGPSNKWATRPNEFSAAFLDTIGQQPTVPKGDRRLALNSMIARAAESEDIGEGATDAGWAREVIRDYLGFRPPVHSLEEASISQYPFIEPDGRVVVFSTPLTRHILITYQERVTRIEFGKRLRAAGCESEKRNITVDGHRTQRAVWRLPPGLA